MDIPWRQFAVLPLVLTLLACSDESDEAPPAMDAGESVVALEEFSWAQVASGRRWEPRAGLQAIALNERLYIMGGRTPRPGSTRAAVHCSNFTRAFHRRTRTG